MPEQPLVSLAPEGPGLEADLPSAREVSNVLFADEGGEPQTLSNLFWLWGQFIDHDMIRTASAEDDTAPIAVPKGDPFFDPFGTGRAEIGFTRTEADTSGAALNFATGAIDGSHIYGSTAEITASLRGENGTLLMSGDGMLPLGLDDTVTGRNSQFATGDERAEENPGLLSLHTLFVREHNRVAKETWERDPTLTSDEVFAIARASVEATLTSITETEFLPALLGEAPERTDGAADITNEFASAAFRVGHTMLTAQIETVGADGKKEAIALRDAFFQPELVDTGAELEAVLRGAAQQTMNGVDLSLIDDVRNFLFGPPGAGGFDLGALNLQRGRDHEVASYNDTREAYGLDRAETFADITDDPQAQERLAELYGTVDAVELFVGGLAETPMEGAVVGETFGAIIGEQFARSLDAEGNGDTLADVIERNTDIDWMQPDVMTAATVAFGTDGDELLIAQGGGSLVFGLGGGDVLIGTTDARGDTLDGGTGDDAAFGADGEDRLDGGAGNDSLHGENGDDLLLGGAGDDFLAGGLDDDVLDGGAGNDVFLGGAGNDTFIAGVGSDVILDFDLWADTLLLEGTETARADLGDGTLVTTDAGTVWLAGIDAHDWEVIEIAEDDPTGA